MYLLTYLFTYLLTYLVPDKPILAVGRVHIVLVNTDILNSIS